MARACAAAPARAALRRCMLPAVPPSGLSLGGRRRCAAAAAFDQAESGLIRISYMSVMHGDFRSASSAIERITERAAEVNRARSITGLLSYDATLQQVWQVLEGHEKDVMPIWESIQNDGRHAIDKASISVEDEVKRAFPTEWGMKLRLRGIGQI